MQFGIKVWAPMSEDTNGAKRTKAQSKRMAGLWTGKPKKSDEHIVATSQG